MLCDVCEDTLSRMLDSTEEKVDHHSSHANLIDSAVDGCFVCSSIIDNIDLWNHRIGQHPSRPLTSWLAGSHGYREKSMRVTIWLNDDNDDCELCGGEDGGHLAGEYNFTPMNTHARLGDREERRFPTGFSNYTDSAETTSHITNWMGQCIDAHDVCREGREAMWMPSRLLEINDVRGDLHLRLRDRSELQDGRYCTLSHCWGALGSQNLQLTTDSLSSFRNGIAVSTLRQTFQDMADLTWRLGVRSMWIDCMCIVQDDTQDWKNESALMGKVYANSWLNVSANAWDAGSLGLYTERYVSGNFGRFRTRYDASGEATTWTVTPEHEWFEEVERAPVNTRAWVLQERILSPRIVHMCSKLVFWECRQLQASEHLPYGEGTYRESGNSHSKMKRICYGIQDKNQDDVLADWEFLVRRYAGCGLTYETDRLIALSGIASMVHKRTQCDYLAGFWIKGLPTGLLWYSSWPVTHETVAETMTNVDGSPKYVAPSWSWASAINRINWPRHEKDSWTYATVQRCETSLANPADMFGAVLAGIVELRAPLGTLDWIGKHGDGEDYSMPIHDITDIKISIPEESGRAETIAQFSSMHDGKKLVLLDRDEYLDFHTAHFTVIRTQSEATQYRNDNTTVLGFNVDGLLLKRLPCSRYVRIGVAFLEFDTEQDFISKMPEQDVIII